MAVDLDDEILKDFLVEAGEILQSLNEQLVELENTPDDSDLLNAIFRGFHTVKGGGGFLALTNLVDVCHKSEDVFNLLRNHEISLTADMMDAFLRVLDEVNNMFEEIRSGEDPSAADPALIRELVDMLKTGDTGPVATSNMQKEDIKEDIAENVSNDDQRSGAVDEKKSTTEDFLSGKDEITDEEFETLLDELHVDSGSRINDKTVLDDKHAIDSDEITDDEFEALLDELHGKGGKPKMVSADGAADTVNSEENVKKAEPVKLDNGNITDEEFESLLDEMHGKGKGPTSSQVKKEKEEKTAEVSKPVFKAQHQDRGIIKGDTTIRVETSRLDNIMNLVGELVLTRNRLNTLRETFDDERVHQAISSLDVVTADLQTAVMKTRMQPVKKVFGRFPRVVRDLARSLKKEITLELKGEETDLDKNLVEALADPLVHLVRNAVDHGIESPDVRQKSGKDRQGTVLLSAQQEGDHIVLSIRDDGAGMDPEKLRERAVVKGLMDQETAYRLDKKGCFDLIFMPGLTTMEKTSDISGRGVGMDVVKTRISQLNGSINIDSELGKGSELLIKVPLTLAILPTLMIQLGKRKFALPLSIVNEIFEFSSKSFSVVDGREVVLNRGKAPPVFHLRKWLLNGHDTETEFEGNPHIIMVQVGNTPVGFVVDQVIGQEEVVIKPLDKLLQGVPGMAGSTITGDGNIAIILDVPGLLACYA